MIDRQNSPVPAAVLRPDPAVEDPRVAQIRESVLDRLLLLPTPFGKGHAHVRVEYGFEPPDAAEMNRSPFPRLWVNGGSVAPPAFFLQHGDEPALEVVERPAPFHRVQERCMDVLYDVEPGGTGHGKPGLMLLLPDGRPVLRGKDVRAAPPERPDRLVERDGRETTPFHRRRLSRADRTWQRKGNGPTAPRPVPSGRREARQENPHRTNTARQARGSG